MKILFLIIALLSIVVVLLLFSETTVDIGYKDKKLTVLIKNGFLKIRLYPKTNKTAENEKNEKKENSEKSYAERKIDGIKEKYEDYKKIIHLFLKSMRYRIKVKKLELGLEYGTGSAASTGVLYGVIWGLISGAYNTLSLFFDLKYPKVEIVPDFQKSKFDFTFSGILRVRLVHIINALIKIYFMK